jgi:L-threonylcarbamoyladenylate synthase
MKIIRINGMHPEQDKIKTARMTMRVGSLIVYPTDTVYGIGANIFDEKAILKVYSAKKRPNNKPVSICLSRVEDMGMVAKMDIQIENFARKILPGSFTLILEKKDCISPLLTSGTDKIGIRIPDNKICRELSNEFPITSTSANISGFDVQEFPADISNQLGDSVDLILDAGACKHGFHSTVIDMTVFPPKIIREGAGAEFFNEIVDLME